MGGELLVLVALALNLLQRLELGESLDEGCCCSALAHETTNAESQITCQAATRAALSLFRRAVRGLPRSSVASSAALSCTAPPPPAVGSSNTARCKRLYSRQ